MQGSPLSVRFRLLGLCLALLVIFGSSSLLLGYLIERNQSDQRAQQEQYRRFEIIQATQQAMNQWRHNGGELNAMLMLKNPDPIRQARAAVEQSSRELDRQLGKLAEFDPGSAKSIQAALADVPRFSERVMNALIAGGQGNANSDLAELQSRLNLIEATLSAAGKRERTLAAQIQQEASDRARLAIRIAIAIILIAGIVGMLLVSIVVRSIIQPLRITTDAIRQLNAGQLEIDLPPISSDEFGQMALALRQFRDGAEKLRRLAYLDTLTGLGNRAQLEESVEAALESCQRSKQRLVLFYLDLDNFRSVNDRLGYKAGDAYLCEAATRLRRFLPAEAELFRSGGDRFMALVEDAADESSGDSRIRGIADCVLRGMAEPYRFGSHLLHMSVSIGIAVSPGDGKTVEHLISSAEAAGHAAKGSGRNNARFAGGVLSGALRRNMALVGEIRQGLERREFEMFYQPIVDVENRRIGAAEALIRWRHPQRGLVLPGEFVQVAESEGLINALGEYCLRLVHAQLRQWRERGLDFRVAVNVSARQVEDGKVLEPLAELFAVDAAAAGMIELELTESVLFDSSDSIRKTLEQIRKFGYRLGMDDFGTGYSSFAYLRRLPIDKIKIDRQFVAELGTSRQSEAIVSAMLALAQKLDLQVVAEGVETPLQGRLLLAQGCHLQQGFLYSPALPAAEFERWVEVYQRQRGPVPV